MRANFRETKDVLHRTLNPVIVGFIGTCYVLENQIGVKQDESARQRLGSRHGQLRVL